MSNFPWRSDHYGPSFGMELEGRLIKCRVEYTMFRETPENEKWSVSINGLSLKKKFPSSDKAKSACEECLGEMILRLKTEYDVYSLGNKPKGE
jgi:hypothetical protein